MANAFMGANVMYCGHNGYFIADIMKIGNVNVVRASRAVSPGNLCRHKEFGPPTHLIVDFPSAGCWLPRIGIFVVPENQVTEIENKTK